METTITKSQFKPQALKYMRQVETTKKPLTITHFGKPVVKIIPADQQTDAKLLHSLQGSVTQYTNPLQPIEEDTWDSLK